MAMGAITPTFGFTTQAPTVRTRKKVPINSTRYFFMEERIGYKARNYSS